MTGSGYSRGQGSEADIWSISKLVWVSSFCSGVCLGPSVTVEKERLKHRDQESLLLKDLVPLKITY